MFMYKTSHLASNVSLPSFVFYFHCITYIPLYYSFDTPPWAGSLRVSFSYFVHR